MQYRTMPNGDKVSAIGFGTLRMPTKNSKINTPLAESLIKTAIDRGINYFDTAYIYRDSEEFLGYALEKYGRDKVFLASKLPIPPIKAQADFSKIFTDQLSRLRTDRIDYYLIHNVNKYEDLERISELGLWEFIDKEKKRGRIGSIGFSFHSNLLEFKKVVDQWKWDFCQIQYNYIDEGYQAGTEGLKYANSKGLGIVVMEPLRGGKLVKLMPNESQKLIEEYPIKRSKAEWGLKWVLDHPEATVTLSGMNELSQIEENARIADESEPGCLTEGELSLVGKLRDDFQKGIKVGCTGCAYCMPCPHGVDIPVCFHLYNNKMLFHSERPREVYYFNLDGYENPPSKASMCKQCGQCVEKCPQHLEIPKLLKEVKREMEHPFWRFIYRNLRYVTYKFNKIDIHH